jgi:hypothetical protein
VTSWVENTADLSGMRSAGKTQSHLFEQENGAKNCPSRAMCSFAASLLVADVIFH